MKRLISKSGLRTLTALSLALFLGAQFALAGHLHADDALVADCLQCQFDRGHAAIGVFSSAADAPRSSVVTTYAVAAPYLCACYRLPARGPPAIS